MIQWLPVVLGSLLMAASLCALVLLIRESRSPRLICLMYHRLAPREDYERMRGVERIFTVPVDAFEGQIRYLKKAGYAFVSPREVRLFASGKQTLSGPLVLLTFDDGCRSVKTMALPALESYGARATVFVTTDPQSDVFKVVGREDRRLTNEEIRQLDGETIQIESHAVTHRPLCGLSAAEIRQELLVSRRELGELVSREVDYLAIPGNWFNRKVMRIAREVGYQAVWVSNPGSVQVGSNPFGLPRINVEGQLTLPQFIAAIRPMGIVQRRVASWMKRAPGRLLGPRVWLPIRAVMMRCLPGQHLSNRRVIVVCGVLAIAGVLLVLSRLVL